MLMQKIPLVTLGLSLYVEEDQGLLFHHTTQTLYHLPTLSVVIALAIDEGLSEVECFDELPSASKIPSEERYNIYLETYRKISQLFLVQDLSLPTNHVTYLAGQYQDIKKYQGSQNLSYKAGLTVYGVGEAIFGISSEDKALKQSIYELLKLIELSSEQIDFHIEIKCDTKNVAKGLYNIFSNQLPVELGITFEEVIPVVIDHMQVLTFQFSDYDFCFHGAALKSSYGNLLLPGKSGAGKSTLSAVLTNKKYTLYSDEFAILDKDFTLKTLALPIAIKSGSWSVLASQYTELRSATVCKRLDGRQLKYIWPKGFAGEKNDQPTLILSPTFDENAIGNHQSAKKLSVIETIAMLIEGGYQVGGELSEAKLERFITFIEKAHRYSFTYSNTEQAVLELDRLCGLFYDKH